MKTGILSSIHPLIFLALPFAITGCDSSSRGEEIFAEPKVKMASEVIENNHLRLTIEIEQFQAGYVRLSEEGSNSILFISVEEQVSEDYWQEINADEGEFILTVDGMEYDLSLHGYVPYTGWITGFEGFQVELQAPLSTDNDIALAFNLGDRTATADIQWQSVLDVQIDQQLLAAYDPSIDDLPISWQDSEQLEQLSIYSNKHPALCGESPFYEFTPSATDRSHTITSGSFSLECELEEFYSNSFINLTREFDVPISSEGFSTATAAYKEEVLFQMGPKL